MAVDTTIGGPASDSYATLAEYQARAEAMGWDLAETDGANEVNLRRAAVAIDSSYSFRGVKNTSAQALEWPRYSEAAGYTGPATYDPYPIIPTEIPQAVKLAQMEMAFLIQGGADPLATVQAGIKRKREKLDVIEEETEYAGALTLPRFTAVDRILRNYTMGGPGQRQMVRA